MVRGCQKKTIHIKDTGSKYYEEAYFVLKPGVSEAKIPSSDMISEAVRIAGESIDRSAPVKRSAVRHGGLLHFFAGLLLGGAFVAAVLLIILL